MLKIHQVFWLVFVMAAVFYGCSTESSDVRTKKSETVPPGSGEGDAVAGDTEGGDGETPRPALPQDAAHQVDPKDGEDGAGEEGVQEGAGETPAGDGEGTGTEVVEEPATELMPVVGMRNFRQINDTMASLTGVPRTTASVATAFATLETQLPDSNDLRTFNGSHQVAISKLAVEYCDAMINDAALAAQAIPGFNFAAVPSVAFNAAGKAAVAEALIEKFWGTGLETLPPEGETVQAVSELIDGVVAGKANTAAVTRNVVKGVCVALLASTQVLIY
jgi:hypothetical protein